MKTTFSDFLLDSPMCSSLKNNEDASAVFNILSKDENIIAMIEMSDLGKPALAACIGEVEQYYDSRKFSTFDLKEGFYKQSVGRMVKSIVAPFGYEPATQKRMSTKYFSSAASYRKTKPATLKIKKEIVKI